MKNIRVKGRLVQMWADKEIRFEGIPSEGIVELPITDEDIKSILGLTWQRTHPQADIRSYFENATKEVLKLLNSVKEEKEVVEFSEPEELGKKAADEIIDKLTTKEEKRSCNHIGTLMVGIYGKCYTKCVKCGEIIHSTIDPAQQPQKEEIDWGRLTYMTTDSYASFCDLVSIVRKMHEDIERLKK